MKTDREFIEGIYRKAEALQAQGATEMPVQMGAVPVEPEAVQRAAGGQQVMQRAAGGQQVGQRAAGREAGKEAAVRRWSGFRRWAAAAAMLAACVLFVVAGYQADFFQPGHTAGGSGESTDGLDAAEPQAVAGRAVAPATAAPGALEPGTPQTFGLSAEEQGDASGALEPGQDEPVARSYMAAPEYVLVAELTAVVPADGQVVLSFLVKEGAAGIAGEGEELLFTIQQEQYELFYPGGVQEGSTHTLTVVQGEGGLELSCVEAQAGTGE